MVQPFLARLTLAPDAIPHREYPFSIPSFALGFDLELTTKVTMLVGENGSGKSTLLEALADACRFPTQGGTRDHATSSEPSSELAQAMELVWRRKLASGFFFRAESFYNFAAFIDEVGQPELYGGETRLHEQSHGESFLSLFTNRFREGLFLLDEPEAALSPQRQLAFLRVLHDLEHEHRSQFVIATHSPILLMYPGATVLSFDGGLIEPVDPRQTEHVQLTQDFLANTERYLRLLFGE